MLVWVFSLLSPRAGTNVHSNRAACEVGLIFVLCGSAPQAAPELSDSTRVSVDGSDKVSDWGFGSLEDGQYWSTWSLSHVRLLSCQ